MELRILESQTFYSALITACSNIVDQREKLNAINLFPVADGDTGDNMAATAMAVIHYSSPTETLAGTLKSVSNAAISGARGNSGMIFSQFFNGLADYLPDTEKLTTKHFAELIGKTVQSVRAAILNPVEGTILTAMDRWSESCSQLAEQYDCFIKLLQHSLKKTDEAVKSTAQTLDILREANVVDAGALGFYHFVHGFADYLANPRALPENKAEIPLDETEEHAIHHGERPRNRFCTEAMINAENIDKQALARTLEAFGDSIVLSGNQNLCRFHIHSNQPTDIFSAISALGQITQPKVDDMLRQFQVSHEKKHSIALVTDSSANLPHHLLDDYQIHLIPLHIYLDEHHLLDHYCVEKNNLYEALASLKTYPTTSLPNPARVKEKLNHLSKHYDHVIVVSLSQALSGTHDCIVKSAEDYPNVHVINSKQTAGSQGLLLQYIAQLIEQGQNIDAIKKAIHERIAKTHMFVLVDQFDSLIRSGRISKTGGRIAQFAHLKPILTLDENGKAKICDKAFSQHKGLSKIVSIVEAMRQNHRLLSYNIIHAGVPDKAEQFAELTTEAFGMPPEYIDTASSVIGLHTGKGCIALSVMMD